MLVRPRIRAWARWRSRGRKSTTADLRGREPIDPVKVARVFLDVVEMAEPPLHLVLGRSAVYMVARGMADLAAADARWAEIGRSVDFAE